MARLSALLVINQCNPEWVSEPLEGYCWYQGLRERTDATLVTHERNREALQRAGAGDAIAFIPESRAATRYYDMVQRLATRGAAVNWPLLHALSYPVYAEFNRRVFRRFAGPVRAGAYDVVHAVTPVLPRYPVKLASACERTPFVLGPVNGGLPFPPGYDAVARREFAAFYRLRPLGRLLPGYAATYQRADAVLAGSHHTAGLLHHTFPALGDRIQLFHENGVASEFFGVPRVRPIVEGQFTLLFVGRLVPFKGCDLLIEAVARAAEPRVVVTVVGDGPQRQELQHLAVRLGLQKRVHFAGWIDHSETVRYYRAADAFCFPSIREFGGAVVLEAMAAGLPSIVVDYGGIGEYVTRDCGWKIPPQPRSQLIDGLVDAIRLAASDVELWRRMSQRAIERAREFEWGRKCDLIVRLYETLCDGRGVSANPVKPPAASM